MPILIQRGSSETGPRLVRLFALLLVCLLTVRTHAAEDYDRWFVLLLDGQRCGFTHEWQVTDADRISTFNTMAMAIRRGPSDEVRIEMESEFVETVRGEPILSRSVQSLGAAPVTREMEWTDQGVRIVTIQGGRESREVQPAPTEAWLTPAAAAEFIRARLAAGAETIEYRAIDPSSGLELALTTMRDFEPARVDLMGHSAEATMCISTSSAAPGLRTRVWIDSDGRTVRQEIPLGGLTLTAVMADQATAMEPGEAPELMVQTLVTPDRPIDQPRRTRRASFVLSISGDGWMPDIPATSNQTVEILGSDTVRVVVHTDEPVPAEVADTTEFLASSAMLDLADPEIRALAERSVARVGDDVAARAEALRRAVYRHIRNKSLGVGFATASDVCRSRAGDCSEHGVLLAALLRASGIPSRVVSGLVYADEFLGREGVFGFHMWTQALIDVDGRMQWVDLDATLSASTPFDATHIALAVSSLSDSTGSSDMTSIATMLGTLSIKVERAAR